MSNHKNIMSNHKNNESAKSMLVRFLKDRNLIRFLPWRFLKLYVYPLLIRAQKEPYNAADYFESYYDLYEGESTSDITTIGTNTNVLHGFYHYNLVENSIIQQILRENYQPDSVDLLDIGSGAGHWIDFYRRLFNVTSATSFEISEKCRNHLSDKYADTNTLIQSSDLSESSSIDFSRKFDVINAVGVMFHITDDVKWDTAVGNMAKLLNEGGIIIVGGEFGRISQDVEFAPTDNFSSEAELKSKISNVALVTKRVRSLRKWKTTASKHNLAVTRLIKSHNLRQIITPENNVLMLRHQG